MVFPTDLTANVTGGGIASVGVYSLLDNQFVTHTDTDYWKIFSATESYWQASPCDFCQITLSLPAYVEFDDIQIVSSIPVHEISTYVPTMSSSYVFQPGLGIPATSKLMYFTFEPDPVEAPLQVTSITATYNSTPAVSANVASVASTPAARPASGLVYPRR
jgi:hypothetical protein